jgi:hypothetical protein
VAFSQEKATLLSSQKVYVDSESALNPSIPKESLYGPWMSDAGIACCLEDERIDGKDAQRISGVRP